MDGTRRRALLNTAVAVVAGGVLWMAAASISVIRAARGRTYSDIASIPARRVGLVLGCSPLLANGWRNAFFDNRMEAAAALLRAGKVEYLVVSGDNHTRGYDEPRDMKDRLVSLGVPEGRIYCDYAGFRTLDSIVRVREVFGQTDVTVVSQKFHNERAIFIARNRGVNAIGFNAPEVDPYDSFKTKVREVVARGNMLIDLFVIHRQPKFLGQKVDIPNAS